jgi:hypothetical protein
MEFHRSQDKDPHPDNTQAGIANTALLYPYIPSVMFALHIVYEVCSSFCGTPFDNTL